MTCVIERFPSIATELEPCC